MPSSNDSTVCRSQTIVLVHGLYMHGACLALLARRLSQQGYRTRLFTYPSLRQTLADSALALATLIRSAETPVVHLVAHSMGGLLVRHLLACAPTLPPGRVVTLGTPHQGSCVARKLGAGRLRFMLGHSIERGLLGDLPPWPVDRELGSIAGTLNVGLGRLFGPVPDPADGTVTVAETCLAGMRDHICLPISHTGMLFSPLVAEQVSAFLATGRFIHRSDVSAQQPPGRDPSIVQNFTNP
ncbi:MAG TPA: alpha/beta fold hydrolase [Candidatus Competibacteraceae bacterium]|nr:alpha/beta fold hydrolase [Candidatus Competibacteraceae bacterium]